MNTILHIFVPGIPRPAGSKRGFAFHRKNGKLGVALADATGANGKEWRATLSGVISQAWQSAPLDDAVTLDLEFVLPRPKSHYTKKGLRPNAPHWHTSKPDRLKLARAVEDAMTGVVWRDDSLTVTGSTCKRYGERPGVRIVVLPAPQMPSSVQ